MAQQSGDGGFLRGQKWERFSVQHTQADFNVVPDGTIHGRVLYLLPTQIIMTVRLRQPNVRSKRFASLTIA